MEGTVLLAPVSYGDPPPDTLHRPAPLDATIVPKGIGARLGPSARLLDESIDDLRALDR
ncbi:hypothetical protein [Kribbella sp. VKM Ac-2569]|uniref:hypothetical protein n=1 Tax=Kribbella sp. VKM Ac-2569 TaxID=2512220 RepID=UPI001300996D|nr:hypothetical protein [Kribbella sp. VKM Ac-2569]